MREFDIRPAAVVDEYLRLSAADADTLFPDRKELATRPCPGCGADRPRPAFEKNGFSLCRCDGCETLYVNPCPDAEQLVPLYRDSPSTRYWADVFFPAVAEARRGRIFRPRAERILEILKPRGMGGRFMEVGAGAGILLEELQSLDAGLDLCAVEPGAALAATCREKGFHTFEGFAADAARDAGWAETANMVACFEVIEHVPDALDFVQSLAALVRPGGMVLLSGLCGDGFDIRTLGACSKAVAPPHHLTFLSVAGTELLMTRAGLVDPVITTPGELDVDIVVNALCDDDGVVSDPFLRTILLRTDDGPRRAFQSFLQKNRLSSHMWALARRAPRDA